MMGQKSSNQVPIRNDDFLKDMVQFLFMGS